MDCNPPRLLSPWNFSGKNTGMGCHFLLQGIFSILGLNLSLLRSPALPGEFFTTVPPGKSSLWMTLKSYLQPWPPAWTPLSYFPLPCDISHSSCQKLSSLSPESGVLRFMGSQRVGHYWMTELNWTERCDHCDRDILYFKGDWGEPPELHPKHISAALLSGPHETGIQENHHSSDGVWDREYHVLTECPSLPLRISGEDRLVSLYQKG